MSEDLTTLAAWLAGDWSNREQSWAAPAFFAHIRLCMRPLPWHVFDGLGFYSEQADDYDWKNPYRVRLLRLLDVDGAIHTENYALKDESLYIGACREPERLTTLSRDLIEQLPGCTFRFERKDDAFHGHVLPGKGCRIFRRGQVTYLQGEAVLNADTYISHDRGFDLETDTQVWGSVSGPFYFKKQVDFATEVYSLMRP